MIDHLKWWWYEEHGRLWVIPICLLVGSVLGAMAVTLLDDKALYAIGLFMSVLVLGCSVVFIYFWIKDGTRF